VAGAAAHSAAAAAAGCVLPQPPLRGVYRAGSLTSWHENPQQRQQQQQQHSDPLRGSGDRDAQARRTYYGDVSHALCARHALQPSQQRSFGLLRMAVPCLACVVHCASVRALFLSPASPRSRHPPLSATDELDCESSQPPPRIYTISSPDAAGISTRYAYYIILL